jgi:hypothetical protein
LHSHALTLKIGARGGKHFHSKTERFHDSRRRTFQMINYQSYQLQNLLVESLVIRNWQMVIDQWEVRVVGCGMNLIN